MPQHDYPEDFSCSLTLSHRFGRFLVGRSHHDRGREVPLDPRDALALAEMIGPGTVVAEKVRVAVQADCARAERAYAESVVRHQQEVDHLQRDAQTMHDAQRLAEEFVTGRDRQEPVPFAGTLPPSVSTRSEP